jgi:hypothetical protein
VNGTYVYYSKTIPTGMAKMVTDVVVTEISEWNYNQGQLRPLKYTYDKRDSNNKRQVKLSFDWKAKNATNNIASEGWRVAIVPGTLDKLLYNLAVSYDLRRGKRQLAYQVPDGANLKSYQFRIAGEESVATDMGSFRATRLERSNGKETTIWCAAKVGYLPIKLEQDGLTMTLKSLSRVPAI